MNKLRSVIQENKPFKLIVLLPVHSDSNYKLLASTRYVMKFQYETISRGGNSLIEKLHKEFPDVDLSNYISFHTLRTHDVLHNRYVTEPIYVHCKAMIVDDKVAIIGSANINDRRYFNYYYFIYLKEFHYFLI